MNNQFDSPRERSRSLASLEQPAPLSRGELTKSLAQSVTRRAALKKFGVGLAGMALACFGLAHKAAANNRCNVCVEACLASGYSRQYCSVNHCGLVSNKPNPG